MILRKVAASLIAVSTLFAISAVNAAEEAKVDHFKIEMGAEKIKVGEAVDVTITAVDKDDNTIESYMGDILIFSESDANAEFPGDLSGNTYKFKDSDAGMVKFENAVKFSKVGTQDILVFDEKDEDVFGKAEIEVVDEDTVIANKEIIITAPTNASTIATNEVQVTGNTEKNHKVIIKVNGEKDLETTSDDEWSFSVLVKELKDGENTFVATIYDADNNEIGTSDKVTITAKNSAPVMDAIKVTPKEDVEAKSTIKVEVLATPKLEEVSIIFNDALVKLEESEEGKYTTDITAPLNAGEYIIDVTLKDDLGHVTNKPGAEKITVKVVEVKEEPIKEEPVKEEPVKEEPKQEEPKDVELDAAKLKITGIKLEKLKNKSILSWDEIKEADSYNIYKLDKASGTKKLIENVKKAETTLYITGDKVEYDDFFISAIWVDKEGKSQEITDLSDMTKVQTGPAEILFLLIVSMLLGYMIIRRREA